MSGKVVLVAVTASLLAGCSGEDPWKANRPATVPAEGIVTLDGKPLEGASVVFAPIDGGHAASAPTDEEGRFVLQAFSPDDGAVPGSYKVGISKTVEILAAAGAAAPTDPDAAHAAQGAAEGANVVGWKNVLPKNYANPNTSGLLAEIPADGSADLKFELQAAKN